MNEIPFWNYCSVNLAQGHVLHFRKHHRQRKFAEQEVEQELELDF